MVSACRRVWRKAVQTYHLACARDDAAGRGLRVPSGVWVCDRCEQAVLELTALREHVRTVHAFP